MSYCVNCGVELADNQEKCPLCGVKVVNPAREGQPLAEPSFPPEKYNQLMAKRHKLALLSVAALLLIPLLSVLVCDFAMNKGITWSIYVIAAYIFAYATVLPPTAIKRHRVSWCLLINYVSLALCLWIVCQATEGAWFWRFSLPLMTVFFVLVYVAYILSRHTPWDFFKVGSVLLGALGLFTLFTEWLINETFFAGKDLRWSLFTVIPCVALGIVFAVIGYNRDIKRSVKKRFFY